MGFHDQRRLQMLKFYNREIQHLTHPLPTTFIWILLLTATQLCLAWMLQDTHLIIRFSVAFFVGAFLSHGLMVLSHEATHNLIFKGARLNRLAGLFCDFANVLPTSMAFRKYHRLHHLYLSNPKKDPDIVSALEHRWVGKHWSKKLIWICCLGLSQALRPMKCRELQFWDRWIVLNISLQFVVCSAIVCWLGTTALVYLLISFCFASGPHILGGRWIAEHFGTNEKQETISYYGPLNRCMFNMGYHVEHHDFSHIPWQNLPKLKKIAPEFYQQLSSHQSYFTVLKTFITNPNVDTRTRYLSS